MTGLWSIRLVYRRAPNEAAVRTAVTAAEDAREAMEWLHGEVRAKGELPGYRLVDWDGEDVTAYARAFVAAHP